MFDIRIYSTGWRIGFGPFHLRWNHQRNGEHTVYKELTIGRMKSGELIGGATWQEWWRSKQDQNRAREEAEERRHQEWLKQEDTRNKFRSFLATL